MKGLSQIIGESQGCLLLRPGELPNTIIVEMDAIPEEKEYIDYVNNKRRTQTEYAIVKESVVCLGPSHPTNDKIIEESIKAMIAEVQHAVSLYDAA